MHFSTLTLLASALTSISSALPSPSTTLQRRDLNANSQELTCENPGGSDPVSLGAIESWLSALNNDNKQYCASNPDGTKNTDSGWILVGEACGQNNAAVWLQTYETEPFCMTGSDAASWASGIVNSCVAPSGSGYGYIATDGRQRWVEVAASTSGCKTSSGA